MPTPAATEPPAQRAAAVGSISGVVRNAGTGAVIPNTFVSASQRNGTGFWGYTYTDAQGAYRIDSVPTGDYVLSFQNQPSYVNEYWNDTTDFLSATLLRVDGSDVTGIDAGLVRTGAVSGTVTDASTGRPLAGVSVQARPKSGSYTFGQTAVTDAAGAYRITGVAPGATTLSFDASAESAYIDEWWNDRASQSEATFFTVSSGKTTVGRDAALAPGGSISGTIKGTGGVPLQYVSVQVVNPDGSIVGWANTNAAGAYVIGGLRSGSYLLGVDLSPSADYTPQWWKGKPTRETATPIAVTAGQAVTKRDITLTRGATVSGTVTSATTGAPLSMVTVSAVDASGFSSKSGYTDAGGAYTITGLPAGSYSFKFAPSSAADSAAYAYQWSGGAGLRSAATTTTVATSQVVTGVNASLTKGGSISGIVKDAQTLVPLPQANVNVYDADGAYAVYTYTSGKGAYTVRSLPAGTYRISFSTLDDHALQWWSGKSMLSNANPSALPAGGALTGRNALLKTSGTVAGRVTDAAGAPIKGIWVTGWLFDSTGTAAASSTTTDADGRYTLLGLPPGQVKIGFSDHHWTEPSTKGRYVDTFWSGAASVDAGTPVTVTGGGVVPDVSTSMTLRPKPFTTSPVPTITGTAAVGSILKAVTTGWSPAPAFGYQWLRSGTPIPGATASSYRLVKADAGATISVAVTGTRTGYTTTTRTSSATAAVLAKLSATPTPTISGVPAVGTTLTAQPGAWAPAPVALSYQWLRDGVPLTGKVKSVYLLSAADTGHSISVAVTGTKQGYAIVTQTSSPVAIRTAG
ncbi:carboxypeptidase-like regulatory domain-containing protein [Herbiconiux sp. VKM Ac-2851]|uniref:carboxypeptidase regulatory-like domain-containing protein n=1 Tax=Herbiconiux sp. VKM Ac-2851 TaxID=2739025 RepID=UPI00156394FD|nr:carboxypeptidase regulatory-like domain-containing protein [Herbiconiux sp. VKM Ac-2851]